jgi:hypothetical protein
MFFTLEYQLQPSHSLYRPKEYRSIPLRNMATTREFFNLHDPSRCEGLNWTGRVLTNPKSFTCVFMGFVTIHISARESSNFGAKLTPPPLELFKSEAFNFSLVCRLDACDGVKIAIPINYAANYYNTHFEDGGIFTTRLFLLQSDLVVFGTIKMSMTKVSYMYMCEGIRYALIALSAIIASLYFRALRENWASVLPEQVWIGIALVLIILWQDPLFAVNREQNLFTTRLIAYGTWIVARCSLYVIFLLLLDRYVLYLLAGSISTPKRTHHTHRHTHTYTHRYTHTHMHTLTLSLPHSHHNRSSWTAPPPLATRSRGRRACRRSGLGSAGKRKPHHPQTMRARSRPALLRWLPSSRRRPYKWRSRSKLKLRLCWTS